MNKLFLCFLMGLSGIFIISCMTAQKTQAITSENPIIRCGKVTELVFSGVPNEVKTGEICFSVQVKSNIKRFFVKVTGTNFKNDTSSLDTEYQPEDTDVWYKAGEQFLMRVVSGKVNTIRYRVRTGSRISSAQAGTYDGKLSFSISSL